MRNISRISLSRSTASIKRLSEFGFSSFIMNMRILMVVIFFIFLF